MSACPDTDDCDTDWIDCCTGHSIGEWPTCGGRPKPSLHCFTHDTYHDPKDD